VSTLFGEKKGELFLFDVEVHGIEDQAPTRRHGSSTATWSRVAN